jgi:hypothetical protein
MGAEKHDSVVSLTVPAKFNSIRQTPFSSDWLGMAMVLRPRNGAQVYAFLH